MVAAWCNSFRLVFISSCSWLSFLGHSLLPTKPTCDYHVVSWSSPKAAPRASSFIVSRDRASFLAPTQAGCGRLCGRSSLVVPSGFVPALVFLPPAWRHGRSSPHTPGARCGVLMGCSLPHQAGPSWGGPRPALWTSLEPVGVYVKGLGPVAMVPVPSLVGSSEPGASFPPREGAHTGQVP